MIILKHSHGGKFKFTFQNLVPYFPNRNKYIVQKKTYIWSHRTQLNMNWNCMLFQGVSACLPRIYINRRPPWNRTQTTHWCCLLEMFTKVIVICWCSRIAVLKNIDVGCSCGNLYDNIITYNIILCMLTFTHKNRWSRGYCCWMIENFQ